MPSTCSARSRAARAAWSFKLEEVVVVITMGVQTVFGQGAQRGAGAASSWLVGCGGAGDGGKAVQSLRSHDTGHP
jgi:hypothetical protein